MKKCIFVILIFVLTPMMAYAVKPQPQPPPVTGISHVVHGRVMTDGSKANPADTTFDVQHTAGTGLYIITFTTPFTRQPDCNVTATNAHAHFPTFDADDRYGGESVQFDFTVGDAGTTFKDTEFTFICVE